MLTKLFTCVVCIAKYGHSSSLLYLIFVHENFACPITKPVNMYMYFVLMTAMILLVAINCL